MIFYIADEKEVGNRGYHVCDRRKTYNHKSIARFENFEDAEFFCRHKNEQRSEQLKRDKLSRAQ